jgi:hydrogenase nickel incorporation protein HypB
LFASNDRTAAHTREHLRADGVIAIDIMGSPGAGKTALLEATAAALGGASRIAAITGDLATERDADRLRAAGVTSKAITTGSACHLDAEMVHHALHDGIAEDIDFLFIENVGNLVCPAVYDLGQEANVDVISVTEGEDKPLKYPVMFRKADLVVLSKIDFLPALPDFEVAALEEALARVMPNPRMIAVSARTGSGIEKWIKWLEQMREIERPRAGHAHAR